MLFVNKLYRGRTQGKDTRIKEASSFLKRHPVKTVVFQPAHLLLVFKGLIPALPGGSRRGLGQSVTGWMFFPDLVVRIAAEFVHPIAQPSAER